MKIIDPRHVHEIVLCKEPHTVPNAAYCTQIRTLCQLMWIICKAKYRGILSRVTLRLQQFIQQRQISFWAGKKELYDLLVELSGSNVQQQMLTGRARHMSGISSSDHFPAYAADGAGDELSLWLSRNRAHKPCWAPTAQQPWGCSLGSLPPLPITSPPQPPCSCVPK